MSKIKIMSIPFLNLSKEEYISTVKKRLLSQEKTVIFTPNPQMLLGAKKDKEIRKILQKSDINLPDGSGIIIASKLLRSPIKETVCGIDFAEAILSIAQEQGLSVFLLGGKEGRADEAKEALKNKFPSLNICGTHHGYFKKQGKENEAVIGKLKTVSPDIIFVCFGFPEQEKWIVENIDHLPSCKLAMGLGGSIDVWSGHVKRAPKLFRKMRLEWLWRAAREPRRMKIFLDIPRFLFAILSQKTKGHSAQSETPINTDFLES